MPRVLRAHFDERFDRAKAELLPRARRLLDADPDGFRKAGIALDAEYPSAPERERLLAQRAKHAAVLNRQPVAGASRPRRAPDAPAAIVAREDGAVAERLRDPDAGDDLRAARLCHAIEDFLGANRQGDLSRALGNNLPSGEREEQARRAILLGLAAVDPDATAYLGGLTDIAKAVWLAPKDATSATVGRSDVCRWFYESHGHNCLELLREALGVLAPPSHSDAKESTTNFEPTSRTDPEPSTEEQLWFDEQGHLNQSGPVPLSRYLGRLSDELRLFLARLDSCERTDAGDYQLRDARAGNLGGMRVLWDNAVLLAQAIIAKTLPAMTPDQNAAFKRDGVVTTTTAPTRNAQPLTDALRQLLFSILYNPDGSWVSEIPAATVAKIRTIARELTQHRTAWERSEGGAMQTPTASPDLLARLEAAAAGLPAVLEGNRAGFERVAGVIESLGARADDDTPAAKVPELKAHDRQAWQLATLHGMTQGKVAAALNEEHGTLYTQGQVSRMIARAKAHADANGLAEKVAGPIDRPRTVDPGRLELGRRVDRRKPRPSDMARENDDDE